MSVDPGQPPLFGTPEYRRIRRDTDYYGASAVAASYCGLPFPAPIRNGHWQHGWVAETHNHIPGLIVEFTNPTRRQWVPRRTQEEALRLAGYQAVRAIGLPIAYVRRPTVARASGTLLVMPAHSLDWTTHTWNFEQYADVIDKIRGRFARVVVVVHPSCVRKGYWIDEFRKRHFEIIPGFEFSDTSSLRRMAHLFSWAEFVTTNAYGSLIVYASLFGAKVSVYGPFAELNPQDYVNEAHYKANPGLAEIMCVLRSERQMRRDYPWLFVDPDVAVPAREWAEAESGYSERLSPVELRREFGWTHSTLLQEGARYAADVVMNSAQTIWNRGVVRGAAGLRRRIARVTRQSRETEWSSH